jgi:excisionase family DNA binding protein
MRIRDRLARLLEQCELLPGEIDRRQAVLDKMRSLGCRIDEVYAAFEKSPKMPADEQRLRQTQSEVQAQIEALRGEADGIMTQWWEVHRAVGAALSEAAREEPAFLASLGRFDELPTPGSSDPILQVLRLRELLRSVTQPPLPAEPDAIPMKPGEAPVAGGLLTAKQTAAALGTSDKTIYRLAKQGRIPYVRINSSLRFRQADVDAWLESKSFQPAGMKKTNPDRRIGSRPTWSR